MYGRMKSVYYPGRLNASGQFLHEFRQGWKKLLVGCLGSYYGNTISAILLGEKGDLDPYMKKLYQKNRIGHLLAISGLHMSFIGSGLYGFLRKRGLGFRCQELSERLFCFFIQ